MTGEAVPGGVVHELPVDLSEALVGSPAALAAWNDMQAPGAHGQVAARWSRRLPEQD